MLSDMYLKYVRKLLFIFLDHKGDKFYIILRGKVSIWIKPKNEKDPENLIQIATLKAGQSFGELALINNARRAASV